MLNMSFHIHRYTQHSHADHKSTKRGGRKPSPLLTKREAQGECGQSNSQQRRAQRIKTLMLPLLQMLLPIEVKPGEDDEYTDRNINIKDPTPGQILGNDSSKSRPGTHAQ